MPVQTALGPMSQPASDFLKPEELTWLLAHRTSSLEQAHAFSCSLGEEARSAVSGWRDALAALRGESAGPSPAGVAAGSTAEAPPHSAPAAAPEDGGTHATKRQRTRGTPEAAAAGALSSSPAAAAVVAPAAPLSQQQAQDEGVESNAATGSVSNSNGRPSRAELVRAAVVARRALADAYVEMASNVQSLFFPAVSQAVVDLLVG